MRLHFKDALSLANALCGFLAVALFFTFGFLPSLALILLAVLFDFFDGKVARKQKSSDDFGKQLDSLADAVSFGFAPPMLVFLQHYPSTPIAFFSLLLGGLFFTSATLIRLAEYNLQKGNKFYQGLPSPFAAFALLLVGWVNVQAAVFALFLLGALMLSKFKVKKVF